MIFFEIGAQVAMIWEMISVFLQATTDSSPNALEQSIWCDIHSVLFFRATQSVFDPGFNICSMIPVNVQYNIQLWSTKDAIFGYMDGWHGIRMTTPSSRTNPVDLVNDRFVVVDDSTPHPPLEGSRFVRIVKGYPIKSPRSAWKVSANPEDAELGKMSFRLWSDYASTRSGA